VLTVAFSWAFSANISRPLERMTAEAERLADVERTAVFKEEGYRETRRLANALNYAVAEIAKTERLQRELIANVSHDLRTPLTLITGYAEMMRDIPGENSPENSQYIVDETKRLTDLVNDMLDYSKYNSGYQPMTFKVINLTDLIKSTIKRYGELVRRYGYNIQFNATENVEVIADESMILQVIYNLLNNAINYTGADKTVIVRQNITSAQTVRISVTDTGKGISKDDIEKIWDRYYTEQKSHKRAIVGSGIGLSIVSKLLRLHSALYGVESIEGKGTTFWFELKVNS
jgi:signal transduction histidine kinase